jgi:beta-galactosidase
LRLNLNNNWEFTEQYDDKLLNADYESKDLKKIRIPHTCKETPFHYFSESVYQMICGYRRSLYVEKEWKGKRLLLTFEGAGHIAEVFIGGKKVGEHRSGYTAFTVDISDYVEYGQDNYIVVRLNTSEDSNIPPFGYMVDYMTYGGIYRDVYLDVKSEVYIEDVFAKSKLLQVQQEKQIQPWSESDVEFETVVTISGSPQGISIRQYIGEELISESKDSRWENYRKEDSSHSNWIISYTYDLANQKVWDVEHPHLYKLTTQLVASGKVLDEKITTIGFRKSEFLTDGYYLNGRKLKIRGLNRHQSYPYVGYAMPQSMQELDARILKQELGVNAVRTSHYPQSHYFVDECDKLGLLVFTEIPGWQYIGDDEWKKQAVENVKEMVLQYRNHTSIILWGVRINESQDDEEFYRRTNEMAHKLDDTRPTGGVRAHKKSQMFEDVYTYNDFLHNGQTKGCDKKKSVTSDPSKPYLVTEYMGHMFPTKSFDCEEHRVEHALRHATVLDAIAKETDICGSFAWCMFDYNTHKDFGSGDRICYHGVMDMFRNPKYAAAVYESQGEMHDVLEVATSMDIGEHPGCNRGYTYIFTNADSVRMYKNDLFIKEFDTKNSNYQNLKHPPVLIDDFIGEKISENEKVTAKQAKIIADVLNATAKEGVNNLHLSVKWLGVKLVLFYRMKLEQMVVLYNKYVGDWGKKATTYRFEAVKDNEVVKTVSKSPMNEIHLSVQADHTQLKENISYDVSAIRIKAVDENGNTLSFYNDLVRFEVSGPIEIIGPDTVTFSGGMSGTYIKTIGEAGDAVLRVISGGVQKEVLLNVEL